MCGIGTSILAKKIYLIGLKSDVNNLDNGN